ncbi:lipopolysaccharide biosynthesis protein [Erwinia sp. JUb26]|uniref:lipopolysaccharide biosynthesis protein n=1 Tax=Erwinia sp. JUb26 TaxID=2485126 RepID=UPI000F496681|nr:oligosaccharide flippase family protein [Erwinia sp. JUb26]ROR07684.1 O-antigen/teichoic acid export membrane protein [Erwinia sp. JUb26]
MLKNGLFRSIIILASGTALAQIIYLAFIPIITRQYGPEAYGMMGSFMSVINILIPLSALSYPIAVVLPKRTLLASLLVRLCLWLGGIIAVLSLLLLAFAQIAFPHALPTDKYPLWFWLLIPLMILALPFQLSGQQWLIRTRSYKQIAHISVIQAAAVNILRVGGGMLAPLPVTLVGITAVGYLLQALQFFGRALKAGLRVKSRTFRFSRIKRVARHYYDFPLFRTPQALVNSLSQSLPVFIIGYYFGAAEAGFYALAQTILGAPVTLLSGAISNVYYPRVSEKVNSGSPIFAFITKSTLLLLLTSAAIYLVVILFGPWIFSLVFGEKWHIAGEYGQWMAIYCIFWLGARPAIDSIPSLKIQHYFLAYEVISMVLRAAALMFGVLVLKSSLGAMAVFSLVNAAAYFSLSVMVMVMAKKFDKKMVKHVD